MAHTSTNSTTQNAGQIHSGENILKIGMEIDFSGKEVEDTNNKPVCVEVESQTLVSKMT